jgi:hypothetical protein
MSTSNKLAELQNTTSSDQRIQFHLAHLHINSHSNNSNLFTHNSIIEGINISVIINMQAICYLSNTNLYNKTEGNFLITRSLQKLNIWIDSWWSNPTKWTPHMIQLLLETIVTLISLRPYRKFSTSKQLNTDQIPTDQTEFKSESILNELPNRLLKFLKIWTSVNQLYDIKHRLNPRIERKSKNLY